MKEKDNEHYSDKGGHQARGEYWRLMNGVKDAWNLRDTWARFMPVYVSDITSWTARRKMFRDQRDGRR